MGTMLDTQVEEKTDEGSVQGMHHEANLFCILCAAYIGAIV